MIEWHKPDQSSELRKGLSAQVDDGDDEDDLEVERHDRKTSLRIDNADNQDEFDGQSSPQRRRRASLTRQERRRSTEGSESSEFDDLPIYYDKPQGGHDTTAIQAGELKPENGQSPPATKYRPAIGRVVAEHKVFVEPSLLSERLGAVSATGNGCAARIQMRHAIDGVRVPNSFSWMQVIAQQRNGIMPQTDK